MNRSRAARKIGAFRTSGRNEPGYSRPASQPAQQAAQAPQQAPTDALDDWESPAGLTVRLGGSRRAEEAQARVAAMPEVKYADPPRVPEGTATVPVYIDGERVNVPVTWHISTSSSQGRDVLYALEPNGQLHVLLINSQGKLRELVGFPADFVRDIARWRFPRALR